MSPTSNSLMGGQQHFGDTTYTKVFVGGLAWETQRDTMKKYFDQFGEILEAVVITDKSTGRSKGYGFVTFMEPEAAMKACVDPSPVIDGRRANCNLASLGVQRSRPTTPQHGGSRNFRAMKSFQGGNMGGAAFASAPTFPHYALQQGFPNYTVYGYSPYCPDYAYPTSYYNVYGGGAAAAQFPAYGRGANANAVAAGATSGFYPCFQFAAQGSGYGVPYPDMYFDGQDATPLGVTAFAAAQNHGCHISSPAQAAGMTMALPVPTLLTPTSHHYRLISNPFTASAAREQPLA